MAELEVLNPPPITRPVPVPLSYANIPSPVRYPLAPIFTALLIACLIVLACITCPSTTGDRARRAKLAATRSGLASLYAALNTFEIDTGRLPTTSEGLGALLTAPPGLANWHGPYFPHPPLFTLDDNVLSN